MPAFSPSHLRAARDHAGLSREIVAVHIGRSVSNLIKYERGLVVPPSSVLGSLAEVYGVEVSSFFQPVLDGAVHHAS